MDGRMASETSLASYQHNSITFLLIPNIPLSSPTTVLIFWTGLSPTTVHNV